MGEGERCGPLNGPRLARSRREAVIGAETRLADCPVHYIVRDNGSCLCSGLALRPSETYLNDFTGDENLFQNRDILGCKNCRDPE